MGRTWRAVLLAAFVGFAAVAGLGVFLGFDPVGALITGVVAGGLVGGLIWAAARRAEGFHDDRIPPVEPGFPGPPDAEDDDTTAPDED